MPPSQTFITALLLLATSIQAFQPLISSNTRGVVLVQPLSMIKKAKKSSSSSKQSSPSPGGAGFGGSTAAGSGSTAALKGAPSWASRFPFAGSVRPGSQSPQKVVIADNVIPPDYAEDGRPKNAKPILPWVIEVKTPEQIEKMRDSGRLARHVLDTAGRAVKAGATTDEIDEIVHRETIKVRFTLLICFVV